MYRRTEHLVTSRVHSRVLAFCGGRDVELVSPRGRRDRVEDLHVTGAAANVAAERLGDRLAVVGAAVRDVGLRRHQEAGGAEAALRGVVMDERCLDRVEILGRAETF